jgi:hypothetical protein
VNADTVNSLVSAAIWRAEQLDATSMTASAQAWAEVSVLEEELAKMIPASESEGRIARRGAVRAALKAGDYGRAEVMARTYVGDDTAPRALKTALRQLLEEDARALVANFPSAAKHYDLREIRRLAQRFREAGAFGLAA